MIIIVDVYNKKELVGKIAIREANFSGEEGKMLDKDKIEYIVKYKNENLNIHTYEVEKTKLKYSNIVLIILIVLPFLLLMPMICNKFDFMDILLAVLIYVVIEFL